METFKEKIKEIFEEVSSYEENEQEKYIRFTAKNQIIKFKSFLDLSKLLRTTFININYDSQIIDVKAWNVVFPEKSSK